jgi:predicted AAA+ superfamily ATPase
MKNQNNKLQEIFRSLEKVIKARGGSIKKDQFHNEIAELIPKGKIEELEIKYSPFEYLNKKQMEDNPEFLEKVKALYETETGVRL